MGDEAMAAERLRSSDMVWSASQSKLEDDASLRKRAQEEALRQGWSPLDINTAIGPALDRVAQRLGLKRGGE